MRRWCWRCWHWRSGHTFSFWACPALLVLALIAVAVAFGLAGLVQLIGSRLIPERPGLRRTAAATLALGWACTLPFIGWFGLLPFAAALGMGAFMLTFFTQPGPTA